jgi:cytochrome c553
MRMLAHLAAVIVVLILDWITGASRSEPVRHGPVVRVVTKHPWITAFVLAATLAIGAGVVVASGVIPVRASSGHWPITAWLLDVAKLQSVRTYSLGITVPALDDQALVVRGAAHYAIGCESCHGSPDVRVPPVMNAMTPPPPELNGERLTRWTPAQLFSIVKHGIKFTGMPAWPAQQRDDEVWQVVAFLTRLPEMSRAEYRQLVGREPRGDDPDTSGTGGPSDAPETVTMTCTRCHGRDGTGRDGTFPSIAGQRGPYLDASLRAFADRSRFSATMAEVAGRLTERDIRAVASYYAQLPGRVTPVPGEDLSRGQALATRGDPDREIPACAECHGPSDLPKNPAYPRLAGQHAGYLMRQLGLLKARHRGGTPRVNLMQAVAERLEPRDMQDVARYYATLSPAGPP